MLLKWLMLAHFQEWKLKRSQWNVGCISWNVVRTVDLDFNCGKKLVFVGCIIWAADLCFYEIDC